VLVDRGNIARHRRWIIGVLLAFLLSGGWYAAAAWAAKEWPGGGSLPGFTFGLIGASIILFEFLLWPRKHMRVKRLGSAQAWLRAHIWLGLFVLPILILHSGFRWGGTLSAVLLVLLIVVVVSGVVGLAFQQFLPHRLLELVPQETVPTQIPRVRQQLLEEAAELVEAACGAGAAAKKKEDGEPVLSYLPAGVARMAIRPAARPATKPTGLAPDAQPLRIFHDNMIAPYLRSTGRSPLRSASQSGVLFQDLRDMLEPALRSTVDALEELCDRRRQYDEQARMQFWLHSWLCIHLPLSAALVVLMFVHAWVALKYW
jgi:hypothetical protein